MLNQIYAVHGTPQCPIKSSIKYSELETVLAANETDVTLPGNNTLNFMMSCLENPSIIITLGIPWKFNIFIKKKRKI